MAFIDLLRRFAGGRIVSPVPKHRPPRDLNQLPALTLVEEFEYLENFVRPNPDIVASIFNTAGEKVGFCDFGVSPLQDRVYVFDIRIEPEFQRKGYGTAMLHHLQQKYGLPIVPVKVISTFWECAQATPGLNVIDEIPGIEELKKEALRWKTPEHDKLVEEQQAAIREQIYENIRNGSYRNPQG